MKRQQDTTAKDPSAKQGIKDSFQLNNTPPGQDAKDTDISAEERTLLDRAGEGEEDTEWHATELDSTDEDGEELNELSSSNAKSGRDLDVPGAEDDDDNEDIGEEDEENNSYSLGSDRYD